MKNNILKRSLPILLVVVVMLSFICSINVFADEPSSKVVTQIKDYYYETPPSSIPYDDGAYSGTLYLVSIVDRNIPYLSHPVYEATYSGTVTYKYPASKSVAISQKYLGDYNPSAPVWPTAPDTIEYDDGMYRGTLNLVSENHTVENYYGHLLCVTTASYSGTVYKYS